MNLQMAGILRGPQRIEMAEVPVPEVGAEDVLIEIAACGICGSDLHLVHHGSVPADSILGHEFSGRIAEHGAKVTDLPRGRRVTVNPMRARVGLGEAAGGFARFVLVKNPQLGANIHLLPDSVSDEEGALVEPFSVGLHAVDMSAVKPEDRVAIFGAGTIGLTVLAALKLRQVRDIVVFDMSPVRLALARSMGASLAADPRERSVADCLKRVFGAGAQPASKADIVFDCAGAAAAFADAVKALRFGGKMMVTAFYPRPIAVDLGQMLTRELSLLTSCAYASSDFKRAIDLLGSGAVDLKPLITHRFPLEQLPEAFATQARVDAAVKVMVAVKLHQA